MDLKAQKELEARVHDALYKNIEILTLIYPPDEDFRSVFKEDMFFKNNKAAFHQVIHYLLNVLNPKKLKERVPTWPLIDIRLEVQFRKEILIYINDINSEYEDANIPVIVTSHLISPGGFKFVKFMHKLSQFVLIQHMKRNSEMLLPIRPSKVSETTTATLAHIKRETEKLKLKNQELKDVFEDGLNTAQIEADKLRQKRDEINENIKTACDLKEKYAQELRAGNDKNVKINVLKFAEKLKALMAQFKTLVELIDKIKSIEPDDVKKEKTDLLRLFEDFNTLLCKKLIEVRPLRENLIEKETEQIHQFIRKYRTINETLDKLQNRMIELATKKINIAKTNGEILNDLDINLK